MLTFATEFSVGAKSTCADFLKAVERWLTGSPHRKFTDQQISTISQPDKQVLHIEGDKIEVERARVEDFEIAGVRYLKSDDYVLWDTRLVFSSGGNSSWVGAQIEVNTSFPTVQVPPAKKPIFVRTLLNELGGGQDGPFLVSSRPIYLNQASLEDVSDVVLGQSPCRMPIVYISAPFKGDHLVKAEVVAEKLSGMAHVLLEPDRLFSRSLAHASGGRNVYGSTVAIYWPNGGGRRLFYFGQHYRTLSEIEESLIEEIWAALTNKRLSRILSWENLREHVSRKLIEQMKQSGSTALDEYISTFDAEIQAKEAQIKSAEKEIARYQEALRKAHLGEQTNASLVIDLNGASELYPGEIRDIICEALAEMTNHVFPESRRQHVLQEITKINKTSGQLEEIRTKLKKLLNGYRSMDKPTYSSLTELGFSISDKGKHYKLTLFGDGRYIYSLPKSGSDTRGGMNAATELAKRFF